MSLSGSGHREYSWLPYCREGWEPGQTFLGVLPVGALAIRVLGPLELVVDGLPEIVRANQQRIVLECLALRANTVVSSDFLVEIVWGERPPAKPVPQLQVYIANLRRLLEPGRSKGAGAERLIGQPGGYILCATGDELDLLRFTDLVAAGEQAVADGNLGDGSEHLQSAIELFRGRVFPDLADIEALRPELNKLEARRLDVQQGFFEVELALGRHNGIIGDLEAVLAGEPYRERLWESYILGLYRSGRQADALAACRRAKRTFLDDLGIDLGPRLSSLEGLILQQDPSIAAHSLNGARRARVRLDNLPAAMTPMLGRAVELEALVRLFEETAPRLVTITGPGGIGKTRIALESATILGAQMPDGVCWVDLAPLTEPGQVPLAVASALGLEDLAGADPLKAAARFLRQRRLLMVMDNFEHLEDAWETLQELLTAASGLQLLVTSRRPLGLRAEYEFALAPLGLPRLDPPLPADAVRQTPAVVLFLARGQAVRSQLAVDEHNAGVVTRLCHRLDGLPLAIELAAAQLRNRSESELLTELEASIVDLPPAFRDLPERQRTLTATIDWSYRMLPESDAQLFDRLGVFAADPTVAAVRGVLGSSHAVDDRLAGLAGHSLLHLRNGAAGPTRVAMLQSIREYARDHLALRDASEVRRSHALYYLGVADQLAPLLWGPEQVGAYRQLQDETLEFRAALLWAAGPDGSLEVALRLVGRLWHFWELAEDVGEPCRIAKDVLSRAGSTLDPLLGPALSGTGTMCWVLGQNAEATAYHRRSLESFRRAGNGQGVAWATLCLSVQAYESGDTDEARRLIEDVLKAPDAAAYSRLAAQILREQLVFNGGDVEHAFDLSRDCVDFARELGDRWLKAIALVNLADCFEQASDAAAAEQVLYEAVTVGVDLGAQGNVVGFLESLAGVYVSKSLTEPAIRLLAAADAYRNDRGHPLTSAERPRVERFKSLAHTDAGPIRFALAWSEGHSLTLTQAVDHIIVPAMGAGPREAVSRSAASESQCPTVNAPW